MPSLNPSNVLSDSGPSMVTELKPSPDGYDINHARIFDHAACRAVDFEEGSPNKYDQSQSSSLTESPLMRMGRRGAIVPKATAQSPRPQVVVGSQASTGGA